MSLFYQFLICFAAALCFSLLLNQPRRSIVFSAIIGALAYVLFFVLGLTSLQVNRSFVTLHRGNDGLLHLTQVGIHFLDAR